MKNKNEISMHTDELLAILHIIDSDEIIKDDFVYSKEINAIEKINTIPSWQTLNKKVEDFYVKSKIKPHNNLEDIYKYVGNNIENISKMITLVEKIKEIDIFNIVLSEDDFVDDLYSTDKVSDCYDEFYYLENMYAIPNYSSNTIKYKTTGSNYRLKIAKDENEIVDYCNSITVNNLIFDPNLLPDAITMETTFDRIVALKKEVSVACRCIHDHINLCVNIDDLEKQYNDTKNALDAIESASNNQELQKVLENIKTELYKLKGIAKINEDEIVKENPSITTSRLYKEKQLYLQRRRFTSNN